MILLNMPRRHRATLQAFDSHPLPLADLVAALNNFMVPILACMSLLQAGCPRGSYPTQLAMANNKGHLVSPTHIPTVEDPLRITAVLK